METKQAYDEIGNLADGKLSYSFIPSCLRKKRKIVYIKVCHNCEIVFLASIGSFIYSAVPEETLLWLAANR